MGAGPDRKDRLLEAGLALASELSLPVILQRIVDLACEITDARYGALSMLDDAGRISSFVTSGISDEHRQVQGSLPKGTEILGLLVRDPRPVRIPRISRDPRAVGFPPDHPPMESFLGAPVTAGGRVFGNIYLTEKRAAAEFSVEDEEALVILAGQAGVAIANAVLYEESQSQQRWLEALRRITGAILAGCDLEELLDMVAGSSRDLVNADLATIITPSGPEDRLVVVAAIGKGAADLRGREVPATESISGDVIRKAEPAILDNVSLDPRSLQTNVREAEMGPTIYVPLRTRGRAFGTLTVANQIGGTPFTPASLHLIETFADQAAVAIEYARAQQELERLAVMEERERIARELHDGIIQSLFAVGMHLQAAASLAEPAMEQRIERAVAEIDRSIRDLRNYIFGLRPGILADRQLAQAIEDLAEDLNRSSGVATHPVVDKAVAADLSTRSADVVQVIREALSNVHRHARASCCWIELGRSDGSATLIIRDDGEGFDPARYRSGQGLANMQDRARNLGGNLSISAAPGRGTTLRFVLPL